MWLLEYLDLKSQYKTSGISSVCSLTVGIILVSSFSSEDVLSVEFQKPSTLWIVNCKVLKIHCSVVFLFVVVVVVVVVVFFWGGGHPVYCKRCYFRVTKFSRLAAQKHIRGLLNSRWADAHLSYWYCTINEWYMYIYMYVCNWAAQKQSRSQTDLSI